MSLGHLLCRWLWAGLLAAAILGPQSTSFGALPNPVLFVTQMPIPRENNGTVSNTFLSVVSIFGNQPADTARAGRGGDLWLLRPNGSLTNLTRAAGYGLTGPQHTSGIAVRDPHVHWAGKKALFSMIVGAPGFAGDTNTFCWQLYELTNLDQVINNPAALPAIVRVPNQPANFNNINPCYATDDRLIFMSDRPVNGQQHLYPSREEYKGAPAVAGTYSLDPATGDLRVLQHTPSGAFNPFIDSFGRLILTRWDHLVVDSNATDDRLNRATNGAVNFSDESASAQVLPAVPEMFPEPRNYDTNALAQQGVHGNAFNFFFPWMLSEEGGAEEVLNHVGRQELVNSINTSFVNDSDLVLFNNPAARGNFGIVSANTNFIVNFFQITEDPNQPGRYFGVDAPDFSPGGGTHTAGQIVTLTGASGLNPTGMVVSYITPKSTAGPNAFGIYRNPLPLSDGGLVAAFTPAPGWDTNLGTATFPMPAYRFRLMSLLKSGAYWTTSNYLTPGITNPVSYWDGRALVTYAGPMWELQPVEVRSRTVPTRWKPGVDPIEAQVFGEEGVDLATFQADLATRGLALVVSRNVTARDAADKQQPFNLRIPGGVQSIVPGSATNYDITHLQFLQADYLRGYTLGTSDVQPGRRILATPMHDAAEFNYHSSRPAAPQGGTELMSDGSQATVVPAGRAITWQLTGTNNQSLVKERYWITFRPGEVRTCANCHGINSKDQLGRPAPANPPLALRQLLRYWRTNAASAYAVNVQSGSGSGQYGAGSIINVTSAPAPSGMAFSHWEGANVANPLAASTTFTVPLSNAVLTAVYQPLPAPRITGIQNLSNGFLSVSADGVSGQSYALQVSSDFSSWSGIATNPASSTGIVTWTVPLAPVFPATFFRATFP